MGDWVVGGDFNSILNKKERLGVENCCKKLEMSNFKYFIERMDLIDDPVVGGIFTWFSGSGKVVCRIDIFFLLEGVISR